MGYGQRGWGVWGCGRMGERPAACMGMGGGEGPHASWLKRCAKGRELFHGVTHSDVRAC